MSHQKTIYRFKGISLLFGSFMFAACGGSVIFQGDNAIAIRGGSAPAQPAPTPPAPAPAEARVEVKDNKIVINEKIQFDLAKATIKEVSHSLLNEVAKVIKEHSHIKKISIEGHASAEGGAELNQRLSEARAKAVMAYLVAHGIDKNMLSAKGFGISKPIDSNDTEQGREKNRRVEFNIVEQEVTKKKVEIDATGKEKVLEENKETLRGS